jgi:hypothetical protein
MARPLSPQEATEMIMALRRQQPGAPSYRSTPSRRGRRTDSKTAKTNQPAAETTRETETEE